MVKRTEEMHKDVQELMECGVDVEDLKQKCSYLTDESNKRWRYKNSYNNPVGVEVIVMEKF